MMRVEGQECRRFDQHNIARALLRAAVVERDGGGTRRPPVRPSLATARLVCPRHVRSKGRASCTPLSQRLRVQRPMGARGLLPGPAIRHDPLVRRHRHDRPYAWRHCIVALFRVSTNPAQLEPFKTARCNIAADSSLP